MATKYSPRIVTDGLVWAIDAASPRCYDGSGSVTDLVAGAEGNTALDVNSTPGVGDVTRFGGCWDFDGSDDRISFGDLAAASFGTGDFSAEIVFENDYLSSWRSLMGKGASGGTGWSITCNGNILHMDIDAPDNTHFTIQSITAGLIYHLVAVWDRSGNAIAYVNGQQKLSTDLTGQPDSVNTANNFALGSYLGGTSWDLNGRIYLARLYNKALTAAEATQNFRAVKGRFGL